ncbi:MAG: TetR/AcrR family transcriptional regulator [Prevotella sp.]|nr:TetR/AcrR family transcriptional regulator [Prevotella sp.]
MTEQNSKTPYRQQLYERIVETAMRAFAAQGIRAVKMDDIAQQLSISKRTMYELYENKEELLYEGIRKYRERQRADVQSFMEKKPNVIEVIVHEYKKKVRELKDTVPQFYDDLEKYPRVMALLEKDREENRDRLRAFMNRGVDEGYFRKDIDYDMVLLLLDTIGYHIMSQRLYAKYSIEQIFHQVVSVYIRGLCTQLGVVLLDNLMASEKQPAANQP